MLLTIHLLLSLVLHVYGQQERDRACTMLIVVDQVLKKKILNPTSEPLKVKFQLYSSSDCLAWHSGRRSEKQGAGLCEKAEQDLPGHHPQEPAPPGDLLQGHGD